MSDQASLQLSHHTNWILLRRYWPDSPSELCEIKNSMLPKIQLRTVSYFFLQSPFNVPRLSAHVPRNMGWPLSAKWWTIWCASLSHFPFVLQEYDPYHFASIPRTKNDWCSGRKLFAYSLTSLEFTTVYYFPFFVQSMSLNIEMRRVLSSQSVLNLFVKLLDWTSPFFIRFLKKKKNTKPNPSRHAVLLAPTWSLCDMKLWHGFDDWHIQRSSDTLARRWPFTISSFIPRASWWRLPSLVPFGGGAFGSRCHMGDSHYERMVAFISAGTARKCISS